MKEAREKVLELVRNHPGELGATDLIVDLREQGVIDPDVRRAIWSLISEGTLALDEKRHLVAIGDHQPASARA